MEETKSNKIENIKIIFIVAAVLLTVGFLTGVFNKNTRNQIRPAIPATPPKAGLPSFLLQQAKLKDGSFIAALYGNAKTLILEYKNEKLGLKHSVV